MASKQAVLNHVIAFHGITGEATYPIYDWYNQVKPAHIAYGAPWCAMFLSFALCASDIIPSYPVEANVDRVKGKPILVEVEPGLIISTLPFMMLLEHCCNCD